MLTEEQFKEFDKLLQGGFAPSVILLKEFDFNKAGIVLPGLHFSAFSLLGHMIHRQNYFLEVIRNNCEVECWPEAHWPQKFFPENEKEWEQSIKDFENGIKEMIRISEIYKDQLFKPGNWKYLKVIIENLQHNAYHIGQLKTIGRQLGVW